MLDPVVIADGAPVDITDVIVFEANAVASDSLKQDELRPAPQPGRLI
jgi:hypothetical protein